MSKSPKITVMRPPRHAIYEKKGGTKCEWCPTVIGVGDKYVPRHYGVGRNKTMIYCVPCAEEKFVI